MFDLIARVLAYFYSLPVVGGSVGYAIMLLTAAVMTLLMPLTVRATRSTIKMQEVQPKLKELQKKHKDDKQTLNQELMALYSENGINPVGGCLPMLAQLPVFLVLFRVLSGLTRRVSGTPYFAISDHARTQAGSPSIPGETFDPNYLSPSSELYVDLSQSTEMSFGPFDLALEALDVIQSDFLRGIPYVILILFVVGSSFYQQRQVSARRNGSSMGGMNAQQEMILKFLPLLSGIWSFVFPAGLVLYWATSNVFRIGQQAYITRRFYGERDQAAAAEVAAAADDDDDDDDDADTTGSAKGAAVKGAGSKSGSAKGAGSKSGSAKGAASGGGAKKPKSAGAKSNGASSNGSGRKPNRAGDPADGKSDAPTNGDRNATWERRRQQKAKVQAAAKNRREQSSRVTPKGTNPGSPKKKRKR